MARDCPPPATSERAFATLNEIDRIGEAFCGGARNPAYVSAVQGYRGFRMRCLTRTLRVLDICGLPTRVAVSVRLKRLDSIRRKINRAGSGFTLGRMDDVVGVRVVCEDLRTVQDLSNRLQASSDSYRIKDYVGAPARTGYRGIHHIMRFQQPVTDTAEISVRFEIQIRTYLQHQWAIWSESHGEAVKLGKGSIVEQQNLREISDRIAQWEHRHPGRLQGEELPQYTGHHAITVCWKTPTSIADPQLFENDLGGAVEWLSYLENKFPAHRSNALLLVGVTMHTEVMKCLRLTHPLFVGSRLVDPSIWMPREDGESNRR